MNNDSRIVHSNRNYASLLCYQKAVVVYDLTYHFCERFLDKRDRTYDQMLQAARSGKQNIVEGYIDSATSAEVSLKLYNIARGSLAELREDYLDYMRTRACKLWADGSEEKEAMRRVGAEHNESDFFIRIAQSRSDEVVANMVLVLLYQADYLLFNFITHEEQRFLAEGGFREKLYNARVKSRGNK